MRQRNYPPVGQQFLIDRAVYDPSTWLNLVWQHDHLKCEPLPCQRSPLLMGYRDALHDYVRDHTNMAAAVTHVHSFLFDQWAILSAQE